MKTHVTLAALVLSACTASAAFAQSPATKIAPSKGWHADLNSAKAQAQKTGRPLMVVFRCDP
jgi:hypothetical protein